MEIREKRVFPGEKVPFRLPKTAETVPKNVEYMLDFSPGSDHISQTSESGTEAGSDKIQHKMRNLKRFQWHL